MRSDSDPCALLPTTPPAASAAHGTPPACATRRILLKPVRSRKKMPVDHDPTAQATPATTQAHPRPSPTPQVLVTHNRATSTAPPQNLITPQNLISRVRQQPPHILQLERVVPAKNDVISTRVQVRLKVV